jgi:hypothetical protein
VKIERRTGNEDGRSSISNRGSTRRTRWHRAETGSIVQPLAGSGLRAHLHVVVCEIALEYLLFVAYVSALSFGFARQQMIEIGAYDLKRGSPTRRELVSEVERDPFAVAENTAPFLCWYPASITGWIIPPLR